MLHALRGGDALCRESEKRRGGTHVGEIGPGDDEVLMKWGELGC